MRKASLFGFIAKTVIVFSCPIALLSYSVSKDADIFYRQQQKPKTAQETTNVKIVYHAPKQPETQTSIDNGNLSGTQTSGLNLALISQLNEGYIKDLLTIYSDVSQGKYTDYNKHVSVGALLGMQLVETGYYKGITGKLPKSYLPLESGAVIWNKDYNGVPAREMVLTQFGDPQWVKAFGDINALGDWAGDQMIGETLVRSPFQIESELTTPSNAGNAMYNGKVDQHLLANILTWVDKRLDDTITKNKLKPEELTQFQLDCLLSTAHNRGTSAVRTMPYGITYSVYGSFNNKLNNEYNETDSYAYNVICEMFNKCIKRSEVGDLTQLLDAASPRWAAVAMGCHDDWYFTEDLYGVAKKNSDTLCRVWKVLYPEENMTEAQCLAEVQKRVCLLPNAINKECGTSLTEEDTEQVYGTRGSYKEGGYPGRGYMFKVSNKTSTKYANTYKDDSTPYIVTSYELLTAGHNFSTSVLGNYWYAYLLQLGGVTSVDPTNPNTYLNNLQTGFSGQVPAMLQSVITGPVSTTRANLLSAACSQVGVAGYLWGSMKENESFDCSRFAMWCYGKVGINVSFTSYGLHDALGSSSAYRQIGVTEALPGDILVCRGHVMLFIAYKDDYLYALDCGGGDSDSGFVLPSNRKGVRYGRRGSIRLETDTAGTVKVYDTLSGEFNGVQTLNDCDRQYKIVRVNAIDGLEAQEQTTYAPQSLMPSFNMSAGTRITLNALDLELMHKIVAAEARGEDLQGQTAVAEVIFNRVDDSRFPNSIRDVIYAPEQFAPVKDGSIDTAYDKCGATIQQSIQQAVKNAANGSNEAEGALFFRTKHYHENRTPIKQIGSHFFSK